MDFVFELLRLLLLLGVIYVGYRFFRFLYHLYRQWQNRSREALPQQSGQFASPGPAPHIRAWRWVSDKRKTLTNPDPDDPEADDKHPVMWMIGVSGVLAIAVILTIPFFSDSSPPASEQSQGDDTASAAETETNRCPNGHTVEFVPRGEDGALDSQGIPEEFQGAPEEYRQYMIERNRVDPVALHNTLQGSPLDSHREVEEGDLVEGEVAEGNCYSEKGRRIFQEWKTLWKSAELTPTEQVAHTAYNTGVDDQQTTYSEGVGGSNQSGYDVTYRDANGNPTHSHSILNRCGQVTLPDKPEKVPKGPTDNPPPEEKPPEKEPPPEPERFDLDIEKVVTGHPPSDDLKFKFEIECGNKGSHFTLSDGESASATASEGTECTVTETNAQGADSVSLEVTPQGAASAISNTSASVVLEDDVRVVFTNDFEKEKCQGDKVTLDDGTCGTPNSGAEQQPVQNNDPEHVGPELGYDDPNRENTAEPGSAEDNSREQEEARQDIESGEKDEHDQTQSGVEVPDSGDGGEAPGGKATSPDEQSGDKDQNAGDADPGDTNPDHNPDDTTTNPDDGTSDSDDSNAQTDDTGQDTTPDSDGSGSGDEDNNSGDPFADSDSSSGDSENSDSSSSPTQSSPETSTAGSGAAGQPVQ